MIKAFIGLHPPIDRGVAYQDLRVLALPPALGRPISAFVRPRPQPQSNWSCTWVDGRPVWAVRFDTADGGTSSTHGGDIA